jgi:uncharacterized phosphosugar-binding protein
LIGLFLTYTTYKLGVENFGLAVEQQKINIQKQDLDRDGQITDRFNKAVEHLGSDKLSVRIGGLYALERIAKDSKNDRSTIIEILCAFVREETQIDTKLIKTGDIITPIEETASSESTKNPASLEVSKEPKQIATDIQTALTIIGRRQIEKGITDKIDLSYTNLVGANLENANLHDVDFVGANLSYANFKNADLHLAKLENANLYNTYFESTNLSEAFLYLSANINNADLANANLNEARLSLSADSNVSFVKGN